MRKSVITVAFTLAFSALVATSPSYAKDVVNIGWIGPLSGANASIGIGAENGAKLAVEQHNADTKSKYEYKLHILDDGCNAATGTQVATRMAGNPKIIAAATHFCSVVAAATTPIYHRFGLPDILWGTAADNLTEQGFSNVFRINMTSSMGAAVYTDFLKKQGFKTVAIIHDTTDYGDQYNKAFQADFAKAGINIVGDFGVSPETQDYTAILTKIKALNPDFILVAALTGPSTRIRKQMSNLNVKSVFAGVSGYITNAYIKSVGASTAEGSLAFNDGVPPELLDTPAAKRFVSEYDSHFTEPAESEGANSYTATQLLMHVIDAVGPNRQAVIKGLSEIKDYPTALIGNITFNKSGQNEHPDVHIVVVHDGHWALWQSTPYATQKLSLRR